MENGNVLRKLRKILEETKEYGEFCRQRFLKSEKEIIELQEIINYLEKL